jgi:hypothetical protein
MPVGVAVAVHVGAQVLHHLMLEGVIHAPVRCGFSCGFIGVNQGSRLNVCRTSGSIVLRAGSENDRSANPLGLALFRFSWK